MQLQQGIMGDLSAADVTGVHYLPHHVVIHRDKVITKLCIVYDASAKMTGPMIVLIQVRSLILKFLTC